MRNAKDFAIRRIDDLISTAEGFLAGAPASSEKPVVLSKEQVWRFLPSALQTIQAVCSESSPHYRALNEFSDVFKKGGLLEVASCIGILRAAADDLRSGMLADIRELVAAEVFDDLLEMAEYLLGEGYRLPACAIAGAVLEDTLRKLCKKHLVSWVGHSSISKLNAELQRAKIFDVAQAGQIEAWGKLRNKVDHGDFKSAVEIDPNDAQRMIGGLRDLVVKYLG
jgi:hypothetical protein